MKIFDKPLDIPSISPQLIQKFLGSLVGEEVIEVVLLPRKEGVEVYLSLLLFFDGFLRGLIVLFIHKAHSILG